MQVLTHEERIISRCRDIFSGDSGKSLLTGVYAGIFDAS